MGLLAKAEEKRGKLLHQFTKEKKRYIEQVSPKRKKLITEGIKSQRRVLEKLKAKTILKKSPLHRKSKEKKVLKKLPLSLSPIKKSIELNLETQKEALPDIVAARKPEKGYMFTGIPGFDALLEKGIPLGATVLVAGGAGSGKTIFGLQTCMNQVKKGLKCLYMSFEESEEKLIKHMEGFGWNCQKYIKNKSLVIKRVNPFEITRSVDALLMQVKGELLIEIKPIIFPLNIKPDIIVIDSLTALSSAFTGKEDSYRIYIEQLFRFFENIKATSFLITETEQVPKIFSTSGVEEFLADAVIVFYNVQRGNIRERAIEIIKLRGAAHKNKIVAANITKTGLEIFPEQEVFGGIGDGK
ncbi:hypothetical protein HY494_01890 [Candidatus Woesearchaeota archaeon]|nr:hypothetical protein [Candidatus Woesearchaeota archaeon]